MNASEPQQRHIAVALAALEIHLAELWERLERSPADLRLTHYEGAISASEAPSLLIASLKSESPSQQLDRYAAMECFLDPKMWLAPITRIKS